MLAAGFAPALTAVHADALFPDHVMMADTAMMQATFLRSGQIEKYEPSAAGKVLAEQLESVAEEDLEVRCRRNGLSAKGGKANQVSYQFTTRTSR